MSFALNSARASRSAPFCTEAVLLAHGFTVDMLVELVTARLATAQRERMVAGGRRVEVIRFRITETGRQTLSQLRWP
jgi:hypothetical protein